MFRNRSARAAEIGQFVTTNRGGSSRYSGCSLTIEIPLSSTYDAPQAPSDTVTREGSRWKTRYYMSDRSSDFSTDMTTWQVELRGRPVHLIEHPVATEEART